MQRRPNSQAGDDTGSLRSEVMQLPVREAESEGQ